MKIYYEKNRVIHNNLLLIFFNLLESKILKMLTYYFTFAKIIADHNI